VRSLASFDRASRYLATLPQGEASFPQCLVKSDAYDATRTLLAKHLPLTELPGALGVAARNEAREEWISDVAGNALTYVARDVAFGSDAELLAWLYATTSELFARPLYRVIMRVISPTLALLGATKRWGSFRKGTQLVGSPVTATGAQMRARLTLTYPAHLYDALVLEIFATAFRAALDAANAKNSRVLVEGATATEAGFAVSWDK
jgi:hypothetical protein